MSNHDINPHDLALEVINGHHGRGHSERKQSLGVSRSEYRKINSIVTQFIERRDIIDPSRSLFRESDHQRGYRRGYTDAIQQIRIEQLGKE